MREPEVVLLAPVQAHRRAAEVVEPRKQLLYLPSTSVTLQSVPVPRRGLDPVRPARHCQPGALLFQLRAPFFSDGERAADEALAQVEVTAGVEFFGQGLEPLRGVPSSIRCRNLRRQIWYGGEHSGVAKGHPSAVSRGRPTAHRLVLRLMLCREFGTGIYQTASNQKSTV